VGAVLCAEMVRSERVLTGEAGRYRTGIEYLVSERRHRLGRSEGSAGRDQAFGLTVASRGLRNGGGDELGIVRQGALLQGVNEAAILPDKHRCRQSLVSITPTQSVVGRGHLSTD
jgi:hypothetical protein